MSGQSISSNSNQDNRNIMFEEVFIRINLGCKLLAGQLIAGQFEPGQASLVAVSQTLDKLLIHNLPSKSSAYQTSEAQSQHESFYISPKDVVKSIHSKSIKDTNQTVTLKLLLIGCANSLIVYDVRQRTSLVSVITPTPISAISCLKDANEEASDQQVDDLSGAEEIVVCSGPQKLYTLKLDSTSQLATGRVDAELVSERSISDDSIFCSDTGYLEQSDFVWTGSSNCINIYEVDTFEQNLSPSKLKLEEDSRVRCLCSIETLVLKSSEVEHDMFDQRNTDNDESKLISSQVKKKRLLQTNYLAFGLESGFIGVYRLVKLPNGRLVSERLWRHHARQTPLSMLMFDADGNGLDELIIGYSNGRLEARSPFTGQLLGATRCFKTSSDTLAGLAVLPILNTLLACTTSGHLAGYRPKVFKQHTPLQGYNLPSTIRSDIGGDSDYSILAPEVVDIFGQGSSRGENPEQPEVVDIFGGGKKELGETLPADLHIELEADDTKPTKSEAKQTVSLLERINLLYCEQIELERRARRIYNMNLSQSHNFLPFDLNVLYHWQMDMTKLKLKLSILVGTRSENIQLVKLEDQTKSILSKGFLFAKPKFDQSSELNLIDNNSDMESNNSDMSWQKFVFQFRCKRNKATHLKVKLFCESQHDSIGGGNANNKQQVCTSPVGNSSNNRSLRLHRVFIKSIDVPKFSMFTFAEFELEENNPNEVPDRAIKFNDDDSPSSDLISVTIPLRDTIKSYQVLNWLKEKFLCFRFMQLIRDRFEWQNQRNPYHTLLKPGNLARSDQFASSILSMLPSSKVNEKSFNADDTTNNTHQDDHHCEFEFKLLDIRKCFMRARRQCVEGSKSTMTNIQQVEVATGSCINDDVESKVLEKLSEEDEAEFEDEDFDEEVESELSINPKQLLELAGSTLKIALAKDGKLKLEAESSDLVVDLVQSLISDRLHLDDGSNDENEKNRVEAHVTPLLRKLDTVSKDCRELEESERRIQTELYESVDYTKKLVQQLAISNELNQFTTSKNLLNEVGMMLNGSQNAALAHNLNNKSRTKLSRQIGKLKGKISFLSGQIKI